MFRNAGVFLLKGIGFKLKNFPIAAQRFQFPVRSQTAGKGSNINRGRNLIREYLYEVDSADFRILFCLRQKRMPTFPKQNGAFRRIGSDHMTLYLENLYKSSAQALISTPFF